MGFGGEEWLLEQQRKRTRRKAGALSLYFLIAHGEFADLEVVSAAAAQWAKAVRAAAAEVEPGTAVRVELVGAIGGSLRYLVLIERQLEKVHDGWGRFPRITQLGIALAIFIPTAGYPTYDFYFGDRGLPQQDRERLDKVIAMARDAPGIDAPRQEMFRILQCDPKITGVGIAPTAKASPAIIVPSSQFQKRGKPGTTGQ